MKKIFLWIVWGMFLCQGCDRFLDIQPKGYTIPSKYDDYRQLMNYAQMAKALDHYPVYITDDASWEAEMKRIILPLWMMKLKISMLSNTGLFSMTEFLIRSGTMLTTVSMCVIR